MTMPSDTPVTLDFDDLERRNQRPDPPTREREPREYREPSVSGGGDPDEALKLLRMILSSSRPAFPRAGAYDGVSHSRLRLHRFPGYAPELNPDELVWAYLKRAVSNTVPTDLPHLKRLIHPPLQRLRQNQRLLWACVKASDLSWP